MIKTIILFLMFSVSAWAGPLRLRLSPVLSGGFVVDNGGLVAMRVASSYQPTDNVLETIDYGTVLHDSFGDAADTANNRIYLKKAGRWLIIQGYQYGEWGTYGVSAPYYRTQLIHSSLGTVMDTDTLIRYGQRGRVMDTYFRTVQESDGTHYVYSKALLNYDSGRSPIPKVEYPGTSLIAVYMGTGTAEDLETQSSAVTITTDYQLPSYGAWYTLPFDSAYEDVNGWADTENDTIKLDQPGDYLVICHFAYYVNKDSQASPDLSGKLYGLVRHHSSGGDPWVAYGMMKNAEQRAYGIQDTVDSYGGMVMAAIVSVDAENEDYIYAQAYVYQQVSGSLLTFKMLSNRCYLTAILLKSD